jgi:SAM-dependent methyltransferase
VSAFDEYRDTYRDAVRRAISFAGGDVDFFTEAKARVLLDAIRRLLGDPRDVRVLDVGCGPGETDAYLVPHVGELQGIDVSEGILEAARARNPEVAYTAFDGVRFPFDDASFDFAFAICVLHHVPRPSWPGFVGELVRVVRPKGVVAIVEHNPFNPLTRLVVHRCEFDDDAVLLRRRQVETLERQAGAEPVDSRYIVFFPWRSRLLERVERGLDMVPLGAQYVVAGVRADRVPSRR